MSRRVKPKRLKMHLLRVAGSGVEPSQLDVHAGLETEQCELFILALTLHSPIFSAINDHSYQDDISKSLVPRLAIGTSQTSTTTLFGLMK